jgi:hypothetical protein
VLFALTLAVVALTAQPPMFAPPAPNGPSPVGTMQWQVTADLAGVAFDFSDMAFWPPLRERAVLGAIKSTTGDAGDAAPGA